MTEKFRLSLPLKISDLRESLLSLVQEVSLLKDAYRSVNITPALGQMLLEIDRSGPINLVGLTAILGLDKSTVSQNLGQLQRQGYVELRENKNDRRYKIVHLTEEGQRVVLTMQNAFDLQLSELLQESKDQEKNAMAFGIGLLARTLEEIRFKSEPRKNTDTTGVALPLGETKAHDTSL